MRAPARNPARATSSPASECPTETTTPAAARRAIASQRPGELGSQGHDPRPGGEHAIHGGCVRREQLLRIMGPPLAWTQEGALLVDAEDASMGPAAPAALAASRGAATRRSSGAVMTVGQNAVTPWAGSRAAMPAIASAPAAASWPLRPLTCKSQNPGATMTSGHPAPRLPPASPPAAARPPRPQRCVHLPAAPNLRVDAGTVQQVAPEQTGDPDPATIDAQRLSTAHSGRRVDRGAAEHPYDHHPIGPGGRSGERW